MRISDWSSDVCSSDLRCTPGFSSLCCLFFVSCAFELLVVAMADDTIVFSEDNPAMGQRARNRMKALGQHTSGNAAVDKDRRSDVSGTSVSVRVDLGGRRIIKQKNIKTQIVLPK